MHEYDLQKFLNHLSIDLDEGNRGRSEMLSRANSLQGEYLYGVDHEPFDALGLVKQARRRGLNNKMHRGTKTRPPRMDLRGHKDAPDKVKRRVTPSKKKEEEPSIEELSAKKEAPPKIVKVSPNSQKKSNDPVKVKKLAGHILESADRFSVYPPKTANVNSKKKMSYWNTAVEKAAFTGNLLTKEGTPNYPYILSQYSKIASTYPDPGQAITALDFHVGDWITRYDSIFPGMIVGVHPSLNLVDVEYPTGWEREDVDEIVLFPIIKDSLSKTKNDVALLSRLTRSLRKRASETSDILFPTPSRFEWLKALKLATETSNLEKKAKIERFMLHEFTQQELSEYDARAKRAENILKKKC